MPNLFAVPIRLDALLSTGQSVVSAMADFRFCPHVDDHPADTGFRGIVNTDRPRDVNPEVGYVSENFVAEPFSDQSLQLPAGVHLHWALPDSLTVGRHPPDSSGRPDPAQPIRFPQIPDRWLVARAGGGKPAKRWIVESDYLALSGTASASPLQPIPYPLLDPPPGTPPFRFLGRAREIDRSYEEDANADFLYKHRETLTAVGYGEPAFHAFYPNCSSVLGLCDPDFTSLPLPVDLTYEVFGWYRSSAQDPLAQFVGDFNTTPSGFDTREQFIRSVLAEPARALTADDYRAVFAKRLIEQLSWQMNQAEIPMNGNDVQLDGLVCYAQVAFSGSDPAPPSDVTVAVGNSGTEAVSGYLAGLAGDLATQERYENQLEALTLAARLQDQSVDLGPKFEEARHEKTFSAVGGGTLWELSPQPAPPAQTANATPLDETAEDALQQLAAAVGLELAVRLAEINRLQAAYDRGQQWIRGLRRTIYADWYKYMLCCYRPADVQETTFPEPDWVKRLIEKEVVELYLTQTFVGQLQVLQDAASRRFRVAASPPDAAQIHFSDIPRESIRVLGRDWLATLDEPSYADPTQNRVFFLGLFPGWCTAFLQGGSEIPEVMITRLGANLYGTLPSDFLSLYPLSADGQRRTFSSISAMLAARFAQLSGFLETLTDLGTSMTAAELDFDDVQTKLADLAENAAIQPSADSVRVLLFELLILAGANGSALHTAFVRRAAAVLPPWLLQPVPAPRYWQPNEPVILLAGEAAQTTDRHGQDGVLPCTVITQDVRTAAVTTVGAALAAWSFTPPATDDDPTPVPFQPFAPRATAGTPYHPLFVEWEARILPIQPSGNIAADRRRYDPQFIRRNYTLQQTRHDFLRREAAAVPMGSTSTFIGRSILTPDGAGVLKDLVDHYDGPALDSIAFAKEKLSKTHIQTQALTGFNAALLMGRQTMQMPVADPLAFPEYATFTEKVVRDAVGDENLFAPEALFDFQPLRNGDMQLDRLRLIDTFGRVLPIDVSHWTTTAQLRSYFSSWASLPARISQPARVQFRWLSAQRDVVETNSHSLTSPICGWLVANHLDGSLMIYDGDGAALGYIDETGRWRSAPGRPGPVLPADITNPHLSRMAIWICGNARAQDDPRAFMADFLAVVTSALENIDPENFAQHQARALLMSRPVALVRAMVDLQLQGPPAAHAGWEPFRRRLAGQPPRTDDFLEVQFPVRIGEHRQLNDGVVGYWVEQANGDYERFIAPQGERSSGDLDFYQSLADAPAFLSILMDPRGLVHCTTGVLPTKSLTIPTEHYANALKKINVTFLSAPILCDPGRAQIPLPREPGFGWSWVQHHETQWTEITTTPSVRRAALLSAFPDGEALWDELLKQGWLAWTTDPERASITPKNKRQALEGSFAARADDIQRVLDRAEIVLEPPPEEARFGAAQEIREGWLQLTPE